MKMWLLTLRTHSLSGPTRAGAELGQLVGRVVCSTILCLKRTKHNMMSTDVTKFAIFGVHEENYYTQHIGQKDRELT